MTEHVRETEQEFDPYRTLLELSSAIAHQPNLQAVLHSLRRLLAKFVSFQKRAFQPSLPINFKGNPFQSSGGGARLIVAILYLVANVCAAAQTAPVQVTGVVKDPNQAVLAGTQVILTNKQTKAAVTTLTNDQGVYTFQGLEPGSYVVTVNVKGFKPSESTELHPAADQTLNYDVALLLAGTTESVEVTAGTVESAYRVETVKAGGPLGTTPILDLPYSVNVISRQLIDDTQSRNFKEAAKYLPLIQFQEMQGPEILRPESRGFQGANMQNDRKDGMGFAVTTPSAMEEYEQIEVVTGLGGPLYGPANPSGIFNWVTKRPTDEPLREVELDYEGSSIATAHTDLSGRIGPNKMFGYRTNLLMGNGSGYVSGSELRRRLAAVALDARLSSNTVVEGNFSYYTLIQDGYPGWFSYNPTVSPSAKSISTAYTMLPLNAPDPTRQGYGQSFSGVNMNSQISEVRIKHNFGSNWQLVLGVLNQVADRDISTAVNMFVNTGAAGTQQQYFANPYNYQSYLANYYSSLAPRFHTSSDLGYLTGKFKTGRIQHDVVVGSTGYRFASYSPVASIVNVAGGKGLLCPAGLSSAACTPSKTGLLPSGSYTNIDDPQIAAYPSSGLYSYALTNANNGIYISSIIHQQGFNMGDTITLTPKWLLRVAASQDWNWTNSYKPATYGHHIYNPAGSSTFQGVSPTGSIMFKPKQNMIIYGTFASSLQTPDVSAASVSNGTLVNPNSALPPYRSKEGEIGYKLSVKKINFSTAFFRIERPFANYIGGITNSACGAQSGTASCIKYKISGSQVNYGIETMASGRIFPSLMLTGGLVVLDPKLNDTGVAATNGKTFVGMPDYKSNILAEYRLPRLNGVFYNFDWQHVGRRPVDDINSRYVPQYNTFDIGLRYTTLIMGKTTTWRVTANNITNVHYWSTLGPGSITGTGTSADLAHLGEPRLVTASMRFAF